MGKERKERNKETKKETKKQRKKTSKEGRKRSRRGCLELYTLNHNKKCCRIVQRNKSKAKHCASIGYILFTMNT